MLRYKVSEEKFKEKIGKMKEEQIVENNISSDTLKNIIYFTPKGLENENENEKIKNIKIDLDVLPLFYDFMGNYFMHLMHQVFLLKDHDDRFDMLSIINYNHVQYVLTSGSFFYNNDHERVINVYEKYFPNDRKRLYYFDDPNTKDISILLNNLNFMDDSDDDMDYSEKDDQNETDNSDDENGIDDTDEMNDEMNIQDLYELKSDLNIYPCIEWIFRNYLIENHELKNPKIKICNQAINAISMCLEFDIKKIMEFARKNVFTDGRLYINKQDVIEGMYYFQIGFI